MSDFDLQRKLAMVIRDHPAVLNAINQLLNDRLDVRREQHDSAMGETAVVLRGHVRELKSLIADLNAQPKQQMSKPIDVDWKGARV